MAAAKSDLNLNKKKSFSMLNITGGYERKVGGPGLTDAAGAGTGVPASSIRDSRSKSTDRRYHLCKKSFPLVCIVYTQKIGKDFLDIQQFT